MLDLPTKCQSYKPSIKNGYRYKFDIPDEYLPNYMQAIAHFHKRYDFLACAHHRRFPEPPYKWQDFLTVMKDEIGLDVTIMCFENLTDTKVSGTWEWDSKAKKALTVYVNAKDPEHKQKMTIVHECVHAVQDFDEEFKIELFNYPIPIRLRIADRIAEKAAVQILLPREMVRQDKRGNMSVFQIAVKYNVSAQMASYN